MNNSIDLKHQIMNIAREAGSIMLGARDIEKTQSEKAGDFNLVTEYDVAVQTFLIKELKELLPEASFIGEEAGLDSQKPLEEGYTFVIDPIDGTSNFIHGMMISVISIGLLKDGKGFIGVVYNPYNGEMFHAEKGKGAFVNDRKICARTDGLEHNLLSFGTSPYHRNEEYYFKGTFETLERLFPKCLDLRRLGSAALDICYIAAGRAGLFFELILQPYDYAAASVIVEEAGGVITDMNGDPIRFDIPVSILAGGPECHREFFET